MGVRSGQLVCKCLSRRCMYVLGECVHVCLDMCAARGVGCKAGAMRGPPG